MFLSDLRSVPFEQVYSSLDNELAYEKFKTLFSEVLGKHAPLKQGGKRNQALFMTRELSKQIMIRSTCQLRNKFNKHKTNQNWVVYEAQ